MIYNTQYSVRNPLQKCFITAHLFMSHPALLIELCQTMYHEEHCLDGRKHPHHPLLDKLESSQGDSKLKAKEI